MSYRIGYIGWKIAARMGLPLTAVIDIHRDEEAGVFIATSPSIRGLVVEADTLDQLVKEVNFAAQDLIGHELNGAFARPEYRLKNEAAFA